MHPQTANCKLFPEKNQFCPPALILAVESPSAVIQPISVQVICSPGGVKIRGRLVLLEEADIIEK
jgi:hypothetical protein